MDGPCELSLLPNCWTKLLLTGETSSTLSSVALDPFSRDLFASMDAYEVNIYICGLADWFIQSGLVMHAKQAHPLPHNTTYTNR
jgi:hypothetical protein